MQRPRKRRSFSENEKILQRSASFQSVSGSLIFNPNDSLKSFSLWPKDVFRSHKDDPKGLKKIPVLLSRLVKFQPSLIVKLVLMMFTPAFLIILLIGLIVFLQISTATSIGPLSDILDLHDIQRNMFISLHWDVINTTGANLTLPMLNIHSAVVNLTHGKNYTGNFYDEHFTNTFERYRQYNEIYTSLDEFRNYSEIIPKIRDFIKDDLHPKINDGMLSRHVSDFQNVIEYLLLDYTLIKFPTNGTRDMELFYKIKFLLENLQNYEFSLKHFSTDINGRLLITSRPDINVSVSIVHDLSQLHTMITGMRVNFYKTEGYVITLGVCSIVGSGIFLVISIWIIFNVSKNIIYPWKRGIDSRDKRMRHLEELSETIASMDFESGSILRLLSKKYEKLGQRVEIHLLTIVENFLKLKQYLPATLFDPDGDFHTSFILSDSSKSSSDAKNDFDSFDSENSKNSHMSHKTPNILNTKLSLIRRCITIMVVDLDGTHELTKKKDGNSFVRMHTLYLTEISNVIKRHRGTITHFKGDQIFIAFNMSTRKCHTHAQTACTCAINLLKMINKLAKKFNHIGFTKPRIRIGISTGELLVGTLGTEGLRRYSIVGPVVNKVYALCKLNKYYRTKILIDNIVRDSVHFHFKHRIIDYVQYVKNDVSYKPEEICEIESIKKVEKNEWFYELANKEILDAENVHYNEAWKAFREGKVEEALRKMDLFLNIKENDNQALRSKRLFIKNKLNARSYVRLVSLDPGQVMNVRGSALRHLDSFNAKKKVKKVKKMSKENVNQNQKKEKKSVEEEEEEEEVKEIIESKKEEVIEIKEE